MLSPSALNKSLAHTLGTQIRICILLTPQARVISYASNPQLVGSNNEDLMKVLLGLASEGWRDHMLNREAEFAPGGERVDIHDEFARLESELGRVFIIPVYPPSNESHSLFLQSSPSHPHATSTPRSFSDDSITPTATSTNNNLDHFTGSIDNGSTAGNGDVKFLLALNAPSNIPWGLIRAKARHLQSHLSASLNEVGNKLEITSATPQPVPRQLPA